MRYEPVRIIGYVVTALVLAASVAKQVADTYDEGTGWLGLGFAALLAIATEAQRARVSPAWKVNPGAKYDDVKYGTPGNVPEPGSTTSGSTTYGG